MDVRNDRDAFTSAKKKHKKRKNNEVGDLRLRGKEDNLQLADEGRPKKKKKTKVLGDISKGVPDDVDCGEDVDKSSRKEKKKEKKKEKDISRIDVNAQGDLDFAADMDKSCMIEKDKKKKDDDTSRINVNAQGNGDFGLGTDKSSRQEKKEKKDISRIDVNAQGDDSKKVDKIRKDKTRNRGEPDIELLKRGEEHAREERHVKSKKKKNQRELKNEKQVNDNVGDSNARTLQQIEAKAERSYQKDIASQETKQSQAPVDSLVGDTAWEYDSTSGYYYDQHTGITYDPKSGFYYSDVLDNWVTQEEAYAAAKNSASSKQRVPLKKPLTASTSRQPTEKKDATNSTNGRAPGPVVSGSVNPKRSVKGAPSSLTVGKRKRPGEKPKAVSAEETAALKAREAARKRVVERENNDKNETSGISEKSYLNKKSKNVKFSDNVEVIHLPEDMSKGKKKKLEDGSKKKKTPDDGLIRGKRFSKEEDEMVKNAVYKYIEDHHLGEEGLEMVLECKSHPELKDCWKEIGEALPWRPYLSVYYRAHVLFEQSEARKWTQEELELLKKFYEKHGPDWKTLGDELGKHRFHVKDAWRRIKLPNMKKGSWSQEEYQNLFNLVNLDLSMKAFTEKKTKHGMIRDNICWEAISEQLSTRNNCICCMKWYNQLTSSMVAEGEWANVDDYRLLLELIERDAACEEDVDWDNLLEHRSGDLCRKRWNQMVRHIGENGTKPFTEQVEILSQRYCPKLLEARESYDNRPPDD